MVKYILLIPYSSKTLKMNSDYKYQHIQNNNNNNNNNHLRLSTTRISWIKIFGTWKCLSPDSDQVHLHHAALVDLCQFQEGWMMQHRVLTITWNDSREGYQTLPEAGCSCRVKKCVVMRRTMRPISYFAWCNMMRHMNTLHNYSIKASFNTHKLKWSINPRLNRGSARKKKSKPGGPLK